MIIQQQQKRHHPHGNMVGNKELLIEEMNTYTNGEVCEWIQIPTKD